MVKMGEGTPHVWQPIVEEMEWVLRHLNFRGEDLHVDWRAGARRKRLEREIFERYGYLKDIILHPKFQLSKQYLEDNVNLDIVVGEPILPLTTAMIIFFMLQRRIKTSLLGLCAAFIFNVNPLYVSLGVLYVLFTGYSRKPKLFRTTASRAVRKPDGSATHRPPRSLEDNEEFDHVLIGNNVSTLYAAALLSKCGHRCCVLQPKQQESLEIAPEGAPCSAPLMPAVTHKVERYQRLLDVAQSWDSNRTHFVPIGSASNGYTSAVVRVAQRSVYQVRVGESATVQDLSAKCPDERAGLAKMFATLKITSNYISGLLAARMVTSQEWASSSMASETGYRGFFDMASSSVGQALGKLEISTESLSEDLSMLSAAIGFGESLREESTSGVGLCTLVNASETGRFTPAGGLASLTASLTETILQAGGKVVREADVRGLVLDRNPDKAIGQDGAYAAAGALVSTETDQDLTIAGSRSVISGLGVLGTALNLLPYDAITTETRQALAGLIEAAPVVRCVFWLSGEAEELGLSSAEYFDTASSPSSSSLSSSARDAPQCPSGRFVHIWSPSAMDPQWSLHHAAGTSVVIVETELSDVDLRLEAVRWAGETSDVRKGPWLYTFAREPETSVNHTDFSTCVGRRISLGAGRREELLRQAEKRLREVYPRCVSRITFRHCQEPVLGGHKLANTADKYSTGFRAHTDVQNLFTTGVDLTTSGLMGEIQAGWVTASAVLGYTLQEIEAGHNIVTDLQQMN